MYLFCRYVPFFVDSQRKGGLSGFILERHMQERPVQCVHPFDAHKHPTRVCAPPRAGRLDSRGRVDKKRYMHGPIPMKVESCRAEMLRACISPAQILRQGSFQATLVGLRTFGRRTHEDEWDEVQYAALLYA